MRFALSLLTFITAAKAIGVEHNPDGWCEKEPENKLHACCRTVEEDCVPKPAVTCDGTDENCEEKDEVKCDFGLRYDWTGDH
jgi:hypothetical protein